MVEASLNKNTNRDTSEYNVTVIIYSVCRCSGGGYLRLSHKEETVVRIHPPAQFAKKVPNNNLGLWVVGSNPALLAI